MKASLCSRLRLLAFLLVVAAPAVPALVHAQQDGSPADPFVARRAGVVIDALEERARLLGRMLIDLSRGYRQTAVDQASAMQELMDLQSRLDREAVRVRDLTVEQLEALRSSVEAARQRYRALSESSTRQLASLELLLREREEVDQRIAEIRSRLPEEQGRLSGVWEVTWLPAGTRGTFYLDQSGTLVTGQYRLGNQRSGSLRGTFVGNKLHLERIDSERGRDAEIEGFLGDDDGQIRGTWQAYEMVQGGLPHGQWVARRVK